MTAPEHARTPESDLLGNALDKWYDSSDKPLMNRLLLHASFAALGLALSGCMALGPFSPLRPLELALIYHPARDQQPGEINAECSFEVWFHAEDGVPLHGRFYDHPQAKALVLLCHGNAGSVATWSCLAHEFHQRHQAAVLVFDYRGYGKSGGSPSEEGMFRDARAAHAWLCRYKSATAADITLWGVSLGGAVAVDLASHIGARGLILISTFSSLPDVALHHAFWTLPHLMMTQRFDSTIKIKKYDGPLLQCHGDADPLIPMASAQKLFAAAPGKKQFLIVPKAGHNDAHDESVSRAIEEFLETLPPHQLGRQ